MTKVAAYLRCSTSKQDTDSQRHAIDALIERRWGGDVDLGVFADEAKSGGDRARMDLNRALKYAGLPEIPKKDARNRGENYIVVSDMSRLARDKELLLWIVATAGLLDVKIVCANQSQEVDERTMAGWMMSKIGTLFESAHNEEAMLETRKRVKNGVSNARANGAKTDGRKEWGGERVEVGKKGGRKFSAEDDEQIMVERHDGATYAALVEKWGASEPTIRKAIKRAVDAEAERQRVEREREAEAGEIEDVVDERDIIE